MSFTRVRRPEHRWPRSGAFGAGAVAAVLTLTLTGATFQEVDVSIDDRRVAVPRGSTIESVYEGGYMDATPGDLVSAVDRSVLETGAGEPVRFTVEGAAADEAYRILRDIEVDSVPGADVVEPTRVETRSIEPSLEERGEGEVVTLVQEGTPGVRELTWGTLSGELVAEEVLREPAPMVVERRRWTAQDPVVALTFDDGPWPGQTDRILDILESEDVPATFFLLGAQVRKHPELARRVSEAGHAIGNHTETHIRRRLSDPAWCRSEIGSAQWAIEQATGEKPVWFRPPGGYDVPAVYRTCEDMGMYVLQWTVDPQDWRGKSAETITSEILAGIEHGSVVLLHDGGGDRSATFVQEDH
jgi:peptidoglycan/xylan/chitin deacetylase (PgdA/CDA1 family)